MIPARIRGTCPSLAAPMITGDGLLSRISPATGTFTPQQLLLIAKSATECGNGVMEISSRGNLQVRGLNEQSAHDFSSAISEAGIDIATGLAILTNPLAGYDPAAVRDRDTAKLRSALKAEISARNLSARLGAKVSVIIDAGGRFGLSHISCDVRAEAVSNGAASIWRLSLAGADKTARLLGHVTTDAAAMAILLAVLEQIALAGKTARARDLNIELGELLAGLPVDVPISHQDKLTIFLDHADIREGAGSSRLPIGRFALNGGLRALGFGLPYGQIQSSLLMSLMATIMKVVPQFGGCRIYPAFGKTLLMTLPDEVALQRLQREAQSLGFIISADDPRLSFLTCAGAPACRSAYFATKALARTLLPAIGDSRLPNPIHISGCAKRCAATGHILAEIIGSTEGYILAQNGVSKTVDNADGLRDLVRAMIGPTAELDEPDQQ